jgi:hypothetical protein
MNGEREKLFELTRWRDSGHAQILNLEQATFTKFQEHTSQCAEGITIGLFVEYKLTMRSTRSLQVTHTPYGVYGMGCAGSACKGRFSCVLSPLARCDAPPT